MGLGQYNNLDKYCGPDTASSVFLITISISIPHGQEVSSHVLVSWLAPTPLAELLTYDSPPLTWPESELLISHPYLWARFRRL